MGLCDGDDASACASAVAGLLAADDSFGVATGAGALAPSLLSFTEGGLAAVSLPAPVFFVAEELTSSLFFAGAASTLAIPFLLADDECAAAEVWSATGATLLLSAFAIPATRLETGGALSAFADATALLLSAESMDSFADALDDAL